MAKTKSRKAWAAAGLVVVLMLTFSSPTLAARSHSVPNSGASHNCVATSSGILFFRKHGIHLGQDVRVFAPHGGQREYVQGALQKKC
jgi:hypothetical protein